MTIAIRLARPADLAALHAVMQRAYRGDAARGGWTHEADLLDGERIDIGALSTILGSPADRLLIATDGERPIGCVQVTDRDNGLAYLGLLCIEPTLQAAGLGRRLIAAAETTAASEFGARTVEMTVIDRRTELIAYYERRGYVATGERRPFPVAVEPPLAMVVLAKEIA